MLQQMLCSSWVKKGVVFSKLWIRIFYSFSFTPWLIYFYFSICTSHLYWVVFMFASAVCGVKIFVAFSHPVWFPLLLSIVRWILFIIYDYHIWYDYHYSLLLNMIICYMISIIVIIIYGYHILLYMIMWYDHHYFY